MGFATDISGVLNCCYLQGATPGIGGDMSAYEHKIYYGTSENMKTSAFITFLNGCLFYTSGFPVIGRTLFCVAVVSHFGDVPDDL